MHIRIFDTFIALFICSGDVSGQRRECLGSSNYIVLATLEPWAPAVETDTACVVDKTMITILAFVTVFCFVLIIYTKYAIYQLPFVKDII